MFNVRPEAQSPWLHVEPPPADEVPGFRMNPDGSIGNTLTAPSGADSTALSDFFPPPRLSLQDAIDQIMRIYAPFAGQPPGGPFVPRGIEAGMGVYTFGQPPFPNVATSQSSTPAAPFNSAGSDKRDGLRVGMDQDQG